MSVHRKTYTPYAGALTSRGGRYRVIAGRELRLALGRTWVRRLLAVSFLPLVGCVIFLYVRLIVEQATQMAIWDGFLFETLYRIQALFVMLLMAVVGSDLIAKDTTAGAHPLYFSRPIGIGQYVAGKLLSVAALLAAVTVIPGVLLDLAQLLLATQADFGAFFVKLLQVVVYGALVAFVGSSIIVYLSSLGTRARWVGLGWVGAWLLSDALSSVVEQAFDGSDWARLLSIPRLFVDSGAVLLGTTDYGVLPPVLLLFFGCVAVLALRRRVAVLERREA
jgi:hypothetical protein